VAICATPHPETAILRVPCFAMTEKTLDVCDPCRHGDHMECATADERRCQCLVCEGERIGDQIVGEPNEPRHPIPDRLNPRPWRPK
jgi:hypothetical protein